MSYKTGFYILFATVVLMVAYGIVASAHAGTSSDGSGTPTGQFEANDEEEHHCPMMEYLEEKYPDEDFDELHERFHGEGHMGHMGMMH